MPRHKRTEWNFWWNDKFIVHYTDVPVNERVEAFSQFDIPPYFWWLHHNPSHNSNQRQLYDFSINLPKVDDLDTLINRNNYRANKAVLEAIQKDAEPYLPYATGHLMRDVAIDPANGILAYGAAYASFAFDPITPFGTPKKYSTDVHPEARGYPVEYVLHQNEQKYMNLWIKEVLSSG